MPQLCVDAVPSLAESRVHECMITVTTLCALAIIAVILRLISRKMANTKFGLDDFFIVLGMVMIHVPHGAIRFASTLNGPDDILDHRLWPISSLTSWYVLAVAQCARG